MAAARSKTERVEITHTYELVVNLDPPIDGQERGTWSGTATRIHPEGGLVYPSLGGVGGWPSMEAALEQLRSMVDPVLNHRNIGARPVLEGEPVLVLQATAEQLKAAGEAAQRAGRAVELAPGATLAAPLRVVRVDDDGTTVTQQIDVSGRVVATEVSKPVDDSEPVDPASTGEAAAGVVDK